MIWDAPLLWQPEYLWDVWSVWGKQEEEKKMVLLQVKVKELEKVSDRWKEVSESKLEGLEGLEAK